MGKIKDILVKYKYETFLFSLIVLLFGQTYLPQGFEVIWQHLIVIQNVLVGLLLFTDAKRWVYLFVLVLAFILISECLLLVLFDNTAIRFTMGIVFSIYFILASIKLYGDLLSADKVGNEMISAVFSGFIMIGFIGSFLFTLIELANPGSFSNLGIGENRYQNLNYFSFVSILTIGYGDIAPVTHLAKKTAILLGLLSNFYLTFVTAIIISKYVQQKNTIIKKRS